jgi:hypothetical protein
MQARACHDFGDIRRLEEAEVHVDLLAPPLVQVPHLGASVERTVVIG